MTKAELIAEVARLEKLCAVWETAALAGLLVQGLDRTTAARVAGRICELAPIAGKSEG